jgi:hypothetical protein
MDEIQKCQIWFRTDLGNYNIKKMSDPETAVG